MKKIYLLALAAIATTASWADSRSAQQMLSIAQQKLGTNVTEALTVNGAKGSTIENQAYATFNATDGKGFVIVGADDRLPEIIGYSKSGSLTAETMAPQLAEILQNINATLPYLKDTYKATDDATTYTPVDSLCTALWSQEKVFSTKCPKYFNGKDSANCITGCVATALAQVIYYWGKQGKFPTQGTGVFTWTSYQEQDGKKYEYHPSYDFSTPIDFNNLRDFYTDPKSKDSSDYNDVEKNAVAELMVMCGALVKMNYGPESGAYYSFLDRIEQAYSGFGKGARVLRHCDYTNVEWKQIISDQIEKHYPVLYSGTATGGEGGHAFILDGISADGLFHVNWGWAGHSNMFFDINYLNPKDSYAGASNTNLPYNYAECAVIDFAPDENTQISEYFARGLYADSLNLQTLHIRGFGTGSHARKGAQVALRITPKGTDNSHHQILSQELIDMLIPDTIVDNVYKATVGDTVVTMDFSKYEDGEYIVELSTKDPEESLWKLVRTPNNEHQSLLVTVSAGKVVKATSKTHDLNVTAHIEAVNLPRANRYVTFNVKLNTSTKSINDIMTMIAVQNTEQMARSASESVDSVNAQVAKNKATKLAMCLDANQDTTYQLKVTMPSTPGQYKAFLLFKSGNMCKALSDTIDINVQEPLLNKATLELYNEKGEKNPNKITDLKKSTVKFTAVPNESCKKLTLSIIFYASNQKGVITKVYHTEELSIENVTKGKSFEKSMKPEGLAKGCCYTVSYKIGIPDSQDFDLQNDSEYINFEVDKSDTPTAIREISGDDTVSEASSSAYDLNGRRINPQTYRGIMIQDGKKRIVK